MEHGLELHWKFRIEKGEIHPGHLYLLISPVVNYITLFNQHKSTSSSTCKLEAILNRKE